jgi:hypothetical protein
MINAPEVLELKMGSAKIEDLVSIDASNSTKLSQEMADHPTLYARFAYLYYIAKRNASSCKYVVEVTYALAFSRYRSDGYAEKTSDQLAKLDEKYQKARKMYIEAESEENLLRGVIDGLRDRKDILVNLSATIRQEMQTGIKIT